MTRLYRVSTEKRKLSHQTLNLNSFWSRELCLGNVCLWKSFLSVRHCMQRLAYLSSRSKIRAAVWKAQTKECTAFTLLDHQSCTALESRRKDSVFHLTPSRPYVDQEKSTYIKGRLFHRRCLNCMDKDLFLGFVKAHSDSVPPWMFWKHFETNTCFPSLKHVLCIC